MLQVGITRAFAHSRNHGRCMISPGIARLYNLSPACERSTWCLTSRYFPASHVPLSRLLTMADVPVRSRSSTVQDAAATSTSTSKDVNVNPPITEILTAQHDEDPKVNKLLTGRQKLRAAIRDYGATVLVFHIASGCTFLSMWYLIVSSGVDVSSLIRTLGLEGRLSSLAGGATTFVVAYAIHKATAPLRIGLTLTTAPLIVNYLRRKGIMKVKART